MEVRQAWRFALGWVQLSALAHAWVSRHQRLPSGHLPGRGHGHSGYRCIPNPYVRSPTAFFREMFPAGTKETSLGVVDRRSFLEQVAATAAATATGQTVDSVVPTTPDAKNNSTKTGGGGSGSGSRSGSSSAYRYRNGRRSLDDMDTIKDSEPSGRNGNRRGYVQRYLDVLDEDSESSSAIRGASSSSGSSSSSSKSGGTITSGTTQTVPPEDTGRAKSGSGEIQASTTRTEDAGKAQSSSSGSGSRSSSSSSSARIQSTSGSKRTGSKGSGTTGGANRSPGRSLGSSGGSKGSMGGAGNCFPADAWVNVYNATSGGWHRTSMEELAVGDVVQTGDGRRSTVYAFGMRDLETPVVFETFVTDAGHVLEVTEHHIVFSKQPSIDGSHYWEAVLAEDVGVGDSLALFDQPNGTRVVRKERVEKRGAFHPYTLDGQLVVNGAFSVSVHSIEDDVVPPCLGLIGLPLFHYDLHAFQQLLFAPLRLLYRWAPDVYASKANHDAVDGSHHYVNLLESLQILLLPDASDDEAEKVNFASWSHPMIELRLPVLLVFLGCHAAEQFLLGWQNSSFYPLLLSTALLLLLFTKRLAQRRQRLYKPKRVKCVEAPSCSHQP